MINNVLIFGTTYKDRYVGTFLKFTESSNLKLFTLQEYYNDNLESAVQTLKASLSFVSEKEKEKEYEVDLIIYFTDYININEVMTLTDYHSSHIPMLFINSK
jgi:hypothetical protein